MPKWLKDAVFYEIYPQSFKDTNEDGIGDFNGIIEKLDYIREMGFNALWINPCFDSPFKDAGYDVRDYKKVAPRYGCNSDLYRLFGEAHNRGIHVLLDLVPGHTSEEHMWFLESTKAEKNTYSGRYIWTNAAFMGVTGHPYIGGEYDRNGCYMLNFFKCQPALNYGFLHPTESWQQPIDSPDALATKEAMKDVMRFWLDHGCDGFRVDMAASLIKEDDERKSGTCKIWRDVRAMLDAEYPEAALVAEWSCPELSLNAGFHADFYLDHVGNAYNSLLRDYESEGEDRSYFRKDGGGDITHFLKEYLPDYEKTKDIGYISLITCNHDTLRPSWSLSVPELKLAYAFILTMPGVPFVYYGDEIGMRYLELPTKEGGYQRTGSRTPMQWEEGHNYGFSEGPADVLYLPVDPAPDAPTVEAQKKDPDSLLNTVRALIALRHKEEDLKADGPFRVIKGEEGCPLFVYERGSLTLAVNPSGKEESCTLPSGGEVIWNIGRISLEGEALCIGAQSFAVVRTR